MRVFNADIMALRRRWVHDLAALLLCVGRKSHEKSAVGEVHTFPSWTIGPRTKKICYNLNCFNEGNVCVNDRQSPLTAIAGA